MKRLLIAVFISMFTVASFSQVQFSKFKLSKDEPFGNYPGRKMLDTKFKVTSDKDLKYVKIDYYIVNGVGDVISGVDRGIKSDSEEFIKPNLMECTGPFKSGKSYGQWISGVVQLQRKDLKAFPHQLRIIYMGSNDVVKISITKENIKEYFPNLEWMDVNINNDAL